MNELDKKASKHKRTNLVMWGFLAFILYFLITEHWAHIVPFLPWLILLACPFMHLFMHGGHGHGSDTGSHDDHNKHNTSNHHKEK
jgi:hypothetical protein